MPYLWNTKTHVIFPPMGNLNENLLGNKNIKKKYEKMHPKVWQILKGFASSFLQAETFYF